MLRKKRNTSVGNFFGGPGCIDRNDATAIGMRSLPRAIGSAQKRGSNTSVERPVFALDAIGHGPL